MAENSEGQPFFGANALIFGSAKGIGKGMALEWARRGARVAIGDVDSDAARETAAEIEAAGGIAIAVEADVTSDNSMSAAVGKAEAALGEIDIVMNNVGAALTGHPQDIPLDEWRRITELNYFGTLRSLALFIPKLIARGRGHIVNTASFAGLYPYAISRIPYAAAKAAVISLSENLAIYLEPQGIRATCMIPGPVITDIMGTMKSWSDDCVLVGPGSEFALIMPQDAAITLSDGMRDGRILVPTHEAVWDTLRQRSNSPDSFIRAKIAGYASGDLGRPALPGEHERTTK